VGATRLRAADARALRVRTGTPGLRVLRHFVNGAGRAILVSEGIYPEGRFALVNRLTIAAG
jgi:DNA-binding GntR family transcriptional regulator